jgi:hypothetical protein
MCFQLALFFFNSFQKILITQHKVVILNPLRNFDNLNILWQTKN